MTAPINMLLESQKFQNLQDFLRSRDTREALASYLIDEGHHSTFFANFPELMYQEYQMDSLIGDIVKIRFYNMTIGQGVPGPAKPNRQLAGNEAMSRSAFRSTSITFGVHRYAVAIENIIDKKVLPANHISMILQSTSMWWAMQDDMDSFMTLFRDYPSYISEVDNLTATEVSDRVYSLFGRGFNDVNSQVSVFYTGNGTKTDIEPGAAVTGFRSAAVGDRVGLADTDTLTSPFLNTLSQYIGNQLRMPAIDVDTVSEQPFYGLILERQDLVYMFDNSTSTLVSDMKTISGLHDVKADVVKTHPIFNKHLGELFGIRFFKYDTINRNANPDVLAPKQIKEFKNSIYEDLEGKAIKPEAKILAAATTGETVTGLTVYSAGYLLPGLQRGVSTVVGTYQLFVSRGAKSFPYFDGTIVGKDSVNNIDVGLYGAGAATDTYYGRMQIGQGTTATTRWKIVYTGPVYTGSIQIGSNNDLVSYVEDAFKLEIKSLHRWNPGAGNFDADTLVADWATFKAFLGVAAGTKAIDPTLLSRAYQFNRRCHMFETVRTLVFGKQLLYKVNGGGVEFNTELRDYGAFTGNGLNVVQGKKLVQSGHGLINNYAILCFKRPVPLI